MSIIESPTSILVAIGTAVGTVTAAIIGVRKINSQSSYKILTEHRLKQFEEISSLFTKLRNLCDEYHIKSIKNTGKVEYICELHQAINRLKTMFSCENLQEKYVIMEYDILISKIEWYLEGNDDNALEQIKEQKEVAFLLSNIYSWSLWQYIQTLYSKKNRFWKTLDKILGQSLDKTFEKVFKNTENLYPKNKLFSIYFIDKHHNLCRKTKNSK